jgi:MoaA/NifB/PqqE/SkfB family radical SAM enzyme
MDLPLTATMLSSRNISVLHLESTDVCQAACPLCAREIDVDFDPKQHNHLTIDQINAAVDHRTLTNLTKLFMCGSYGDPAAGKHTLEIYQWIRKINPSVTLGMNTNGALRDRHWWKQLALLFNRPTDYVVFSIDGLEDTNHHYRVGVDWRQLMQNAKTYIDHGGSAHWDMLVYRHNEHQVEECQNLAQSLGFTWFRAKVSRRPLAGMLEYPINWAAGVNNKGVIDCHALREQSLYIDAQGRVSPCCWLGSRKNNFITDFDAVQKSWTGDPHPICADACTVNQNKSNFEHQWRQEISLGST